MAMLDAVRRPIAGLVILAALLVGAPPVVAQTLLTLTNGEETVELTREDLEALPQHSLTTTTEFTDGLVNFTGPLARDVLAYVGLDAVDRVRMTAINDYYIDVPTEDFAEYDVILALEADGRQLSRRDKGPIWLMYPISDHEELADPLYHARLIWQLVSVEAL